MPTLSADQPASIRLDITSEFISTIIAFGSMQLKERIPPFEWTRFLEEVPANKIYVRDLHQLWYLKGLPDVGNSPEAIQRHLQQIISAQKNERVMTVGGSMGGYAALLFGHLLQAGEVHAFTPQTFLPARRGRILAKTVLAKNWAVLKKYGELLANRRINRKYFDLKPFLVNDKGPTQYHIYFSVDNEKDVVHAQRLTYLSNVHLHERLHDGHHVSVAMRDSGELKQILMQAI